MSTLAIAMLAASSLLVIAEDVTRPPPAQSHVGSVGSPSETERQRAPEPDGYRMDDFRQPVPATLSGARVITTEEAERIWKQQTAVFIDVFPKAPKPANLPPGTVWRDPSHMSIKGGHWLPNVGLGALTPEVETYFRAGLERLTGGDRKKPIVLFCLRDCWMSWNAAKRALSWGYGNVIWFPDGTDGWSEAGNDIVYLTSEP
ncbi:MAG: PQQ-dependent catabolism-associated CXXCW motif protein [Hyphomicrobium sp.]